MDYQQVKISVSLSLSLSLSLSFLKEQLVEGSVSGRKTRGENQNG